MAKKEYLIEIEAKDVFDRIAEQTELVGKKSDVDGDYEKKGMAQNEWNLFSSYMEIAMSNVADAFGYYVKENDSGENGLSLLVSMPNTFQESALFPLQHSISEYLYNRVLEKWYQVVDKERMPEYIVLSDASMTKIKKLLLSKVVKPVTKNE